MYVTGSGATDTGGHRTKNEDAFWCDEALGIFVVCDGMGGRKGGETASSSAVAGVQEEIRQCLGYG